MSGRKPASGPADADQGNPYLEARARNIALNQAELRKLGLSPAVDAKVQRTRGGAATKGSKRKRGAQEEGVAVRRSSRFRGKKPEFGSLPADFRELPADDQARHNKRPKRVVKPKVKKEKPPQPGDASKVGNLNAIEPKAWVGRYIPVPDGQNKAAVVHLLRNGDLSGKKRVRFNRMGGLLEWKNCLCVWVNAQSVCYDNLFSNDFTTMTWYASNKAHMETRGVVRLASGREPVYFFARKLTGAYIYCGQVKCRRHGYHSKSKGLANNVQFEFEVVSAEKLAQSRDFLEMVNGKK